MTQPDRRRNGLFLIAIAISLLFCLRLSPPPLTSHQPLFVSGESTWFEHPHYPHQSLSARSL